MRPKRLPKHPCECGCGGLCHVKFLRGHGNKGQPRIRIPDEQIFVYHDDRRRNPNISKRYNMYRKNTKHCDICGSYPQWCGKPLTLRVDHKDGVSWNDCLDNLRLVCPNCESQLETTGSRNIKNLKRLKQQSDFQMEVRFQ